MSIQKPNCGNCPHNIKSENRKGFRKCAITNYLLDKDFDLVRHMDGVLCLSHPKARKYLNAGVIKKLERQKIGYNSTEYDFIFNEAISLIRDGVE